MSSILQPFDVRVKERASRYEDAGQLISRIGDSRYSGEFRRIRNMGKSSKLWFTAVVKHLNYLCQAVRTHSGWRITVFDSKMKSTGMVPLVSIRAKDRFELEERMYSLYFELSEYPSEETEN